MFEPARTLSGQTVKGIERYHYHHGLGPHLHPNGICPYGNTATKVEIHNPKQNDEFFTGDRLYIRASVLNAAHTQLLINNRLWDEKSGLIPNEVILFKPYQLTVDDIGNMDIAVVAYAGNDTTEQSAVATVQINVDSGEIELVTLSDLDAFGWKNNSQQEADKLNAVLLKYGIIHPDSICLFLATCGHESGKGGRALEYLMPDGTTVGDYLPEERGAGYIQLTKRDAHLEFLRSVGDSFKGVDTATYIAENYPWEAAAWFWSDEDAKRIPDINNEGVSINDYVVTYGSSYDVFLITQYYVNFGSSVISDDLRNEIITGKATWVIENGKVVVNGTEEKLYPIPANWEDREKNYSEAIDIFK